MRSFFVVEQTLHSRVVCQNYNVKAKEVSTTVNTIVPDLLQGSCPCLKLHQVAAPIDTSASLSECDCLEHTQQRRRSGHQSLKVPMFNLGCIEVPFVFAESSC